MLYVKDAAIRANHFAREPVWFARVLVACLVLTLVQSLQGQQHMANETVASDSRGKTADESAAERDLREVNDFVSKTMERIDAAYDTYHALRKEYEKRIAPTSRPTAPPDMPPEFTKKTKPLLERIENLRTSISAAYEKHLERYPASWQGMDDFANYCYENGETKRALALWQRALTVNPDCADLHNNIGVWYSHFGAPLKAVDKFREAIQLNPKLAVSHFNLATVYFTSRHKVGQREGWSLPEVFWKAQEAYEKAFELESTNFEYAVNCAQNHYMSDFFKVDAQWDRAREEWKRCLELDLTVKQRIYTLTNLGRVCAKVGRKEEARDAFERAIALGPAPVAKQLLAKLDTAD